MTPKKKAEELVFFYTNLLEPFKAESKAKLCALIASDEIVTELFNSQDGVENKNRLEYWQEVKQEIEKL